MSNTATAVSKPRKGFWENMKARKGQRVLVIVLFMIIPLTLLAVFTYIPFFFFFLFSFYNMKYGGQQGT